jgi:DnaK suppressor protein
MESLKLEHYKKQLEESRSSLMKEYKKDQKPEDFGSDIDHFEEESNEAESEVNNLAAGEAVKARINAIDSALNKLSLGKFGVCEKCGREIEEKVLAASPESRLCKNCKKTDGID